MGAKERSDERLRLARERQIEADLEIDRAIREASEGGMSLAEIARNLKISKTHVHRLLNAPIVPETERFAENGQDRVLPHLPINVRNRVMRGDLHPDVARVLNLLPDKALVERLADDAVKYRWSPSQARAAARARGGPLDPEEPPLLRPPALPEDGPLHELDVYRGFGERIGRIQARGHDHAREVAAREFGEPGPGGAYTFSPASKSPYSPGPPQADYQVKCNSCGYVKLKSAPGGCPGRHAPAGFSPVEDVP